MNKTMSHVILNLKSAKQMWDTVEALMDGSKKVKGNRYDLLISRYEAFKSWWDNLTDLREIHAVVEWTDSPQQNISSKRDKQKVLISDVTTPCK